MNASLKYFVLLIVMLPLGFMASCSEDDEEVDREPLIIGVWTLESQRISNVEATVAGLGGVPVQSFLEPVLDTLTIIPENSEITFNQDRTYTIKAPQQTTDLAGTWELSADQSTITLNGFEAAQALLGASSLDFVILSISSTDFSMVTSVSDITIPNLPTVGTVNASGDYQMTLKK